MIYYRKDDMSGATKTVSGTVAADTYEALERYCEERGISKSIVVRRGVRRLLEEEPNAVPR